MTTPVVAQLVDTSLPDDSVDDGEVSQLEEPPVGDESNMSASEEPADIKQVL